MTRWVQFLKLLVTKFLPEVAKLISDILGYFEKHHLQVKTTVAIFGATFVKKLGNFLFQYLVTLVAIKSLVRPISNGVRSFLRKKPARFT